MSVLEHLGKGTLPHELESAFVNWCMWEQARSAVIAVLDKTDLQPLLTQFQQAADLAALTAVAQRAVDETARARDTGPLALSAAKAVAFEFNNLVKVADGEDFDAEAAAFFAARVCGWAAWAAADFSDVTRKTEAEAEARREQAERLSALWQQHDQPRR